MFTSDSLEKVAEEFAKLPSIGRKTAHRIAMYLAKSPPEEVVVLSEALLKLKDYKVTVKYKYTLTLYKRDIAK